MEYSYLKSNALFCKMKVILIQLGKTADTYIQEGVSQYVNRLKHYITFEEKIIPAFKSSASMSKDEIKKQEGILILKNVQVTDELVLLDEKGKEYTSLDFSVFIQQKMNAGTKNLVFVVGGAFGFSEEVYARANTKVSLSRLTFSHQMVRLFFAEQLYRAMTIIKGEKYHHQ